MEADPQQNILKRRREFLISNIQPTDTFWSEIQTKHVVPRDGLARIKVRYVYIKLCVYHIHIHVYLQCLRAFGVIQVPSI